ncbi:MAG: hypothetical protein KC731_36900 [Myxococcales bacterium]|nr:hypothetical protein [Myxococcales bacterium]
MLAPGCGGSENGTTSASGGGNGAGSSVGGAGTGGNLFSGAGGDNGTGGANNCAQTDEEATLTNRPVDIIIVIDNSGSMSAEIQEVEEQINANFATILNGANPPIDYRVIMVSAYGSYNDRRICVAAPLGGIPDNDMDGHCDSIPSQPVNTANFFHHSSTISSHNALCKLLSDYNTADQFNLQPTGYNEVLRDDSFKFFLVITDDGVSCDSFNDGNSVAGGDTVATAWDTAVLALSAQHFGTAMARNYAFWSIIAQEPYMTSGMKPYGEPSPPDAMLAPITTGECTPSAVDPGTGYQGLSILSGGYRYPTCGLDYTDIFVKMAEGVIAGAQVPCAFEIPEPPPGETLDLATVQVKYSSGGAEVATFSQVGSPAECDANSFYIDSMANEIVLCPDACAIVQADEEAKINIAYGCELGVQ